MIARVRSSLVGSDPLSSSVSLLRISSRFRLIASIDAGERSGFNTGQRFTLLLLSFTRTVLKTYVLRFRLEFLYFSV